MEKRKFGSYRGNDAIGWLMHDFNCSNYREMHNAKIAARVKYFKEEPKGVADMCKTMQVIVDRERDDAQRFTGKSGGILV